MNKPVTSSNQMASSWVPVLVSVSIFTGLCLLIGSLLVKKKHKSRSYSSNNLIRNKLPPGPKGLPILGNLHLLGALPHQNLHRLAKKYGPIMHMRLGLVSTIVVSSPEAAKSFLKTHDLVFASRPKVQAGKYLAYGQKGLGLSQYGSYWRNIRKLCTLELLTNTKIELFRPMRREELSRLVASLRVAADGRQTICVSEKVETLVEDVTYRMMFGRKGDKFNFKPVISEAMNLTGAFNIGDYVPYLAPFDLQGLVRRMKAVSKVFDGYLEKIIEEHIKDANERNDGHLRDFIDVMLSLMESNNHVQELQLGRDNIKAVILDLLAAGMDTSANVINWAFAELLRHPQIMRQVQRELQNIVGMDRMVEETDLAKLNYLNMVVKETMRLHPVAPLLLPHESTEDITIDGYHIPKNSRVLINVWTIGRDPSVWSENVEEFNPERFINSAIDVQGHDFQLIPFGSGRRGCPGMQLGLTMVQLILAQLFHCFNWELPSGVSPGDLDMSEKFGITMSRACPLVSIPTYRLRSL